MAQIQPQKEAIAIAAQAGLPVIAWGSPGVGKTRFVVNLAKMLDEHLEVLIASIREPADFGGLPVISHVDGETEVNMAPLSWARRLSGGGILFLDEINTAPPAVQAALLRVVLDRTVGEYALPDSVRIIAASNPPDESAGGWELSPPLANRFCHIQWKLNSDAWIRGMASNWDEDRKIPILPENWKDKVEGMRNIVLSYINVRSTHLLQVPNDSASIGLAWPSPRTWDMVSMGLAACEAVKSSDDARANIVCGLVGDGTGLEFLKWMKSLDLPKPEDVLKDPKLLPDRDDRLFATIMNVVSYAARDGKKISKNDWNNFWFVLNRVIEMAKRDFAIVGLISMMSRTGKPYDFPNAKSIKDLAKVMKDIEWRAADE